MNKEILYRFFIGTASYEEEEAVCNWVNASEENKKVLLRERKYFDIMLLHQKKETKAVNSVHCIGYFSIIRYSLEIAAAISVLIVSTLYLYNVVVQPSAEVAEIAMNKIIVPPGQRVNVILPDGTDVWLNACSEMIYPTSFTQDIRNVSLKGEAYFDVTNDAKHPFVVQTNKCDIKVLGTKFDVQTDGWNSEFSAVLFEGSIELTNNNNPKDKILLSPMQKAEWTDNGLVVDSIQDLNIYRWKEGLICFDDIRFAELLKRFEKIYDIRIVIQNNKLMNYRYSGKCRVTDGIDFILQVLQRSTDFSFVRSDDNSMIYIN